MIRVVRRTRLDLPLEAAWAWLADLDRLVTADPLHQSVSYVGERRSGVGTVMLVPHGLRYGPRMPRRLTITHWEPPRRIRWTDVDVAPTRRTRVFPHSEEFVLEPLADGATLLGDTVTGSLNLRVPVLGAFAEMLLEALVVRTVVRHQSAYLRAHVTWGQ